ncbi:MAG TPA: hypothetical protein VGB20_04660 [bacterium]
MSVGPSRRAAVLALAASLLVGASPAFAQVRTLSEQFSESRAWHERVGDWFATVGRSPEERRQVLLQRRAQRARNDAQEAVRRRRTQAERRARELGR